MNSASTLHRSLVARAVYGLLDPIPFGLFVAALVFDAVYAGSGELLWGKGAAWLLAIGLLFAVIPRLINGVELWITSRATATAADRLDFWLQLLAIVAATVNSFVHSRDAYAVIPAGVWLSAFTVILLSIAHVAAAVRRAPAQRPLHA